MGLFDDLNKRLASFQSDVEKTLSGSSKKKGHTLGGGTATGGTVGAVNNKKLDAVSSEKTIVAKFSSKTGSSLGMSLQRDDTGAASVSAVVPGGAAEKAGVVTGDIIISVDDTETPSYNEFLQVFRGADHRPVTFRLRRLVSERDARREAQAKAAVERDNAWAKRVAKRPQGGRIGRASSGETVDVVPKSTNPETLAAWKRTEERQAAQTKELGYDPYKSLSTGTSAAGAKAVSKPAPPTTEQPQDVGDRLGGQDAADYDRGAAEADVVVQALVANTDKTAVLTCLTTILKLLENAMAKDDEKFRRVRLANPNIQSRILAVEGGLEALVTAGFHLSDDGNDETVLLLPRNFSKARCRATADALTALKSQFDA